MTINEDRQTRIAIVGGGPSGCFLAGALRRQLPDARIMVIDRMPCPYGLVRYGVAADHQGTKNISRQFARIFSRENVEFAGNIHVGNTVGRGDITLDELRERFDVVVLATGLSADRKLDIPGSELPGVYGSGALTRMLNSHPDECETAEVLSRLGDHVVIVGAGNVALDIVRFLAKRSVDFEGSDVHDGALAAYQSAPAQVIDVLSRSSIQAAKCDAQMIRELGSLESVNVTLINADDAGNDSAASSRVTAFHEVAAASNSEARVEVRFRFNSVPVAVTGSECVEGVEVKQNSAPAVTLQASSVITAIGFEADAHTPVVNTDESNLSCLEPGLYRVGWLRRGPRGTIPENRKDAVAVAQQIVDDLARGAIPLRRISPDEPLLPQRDSLRPVSFDQWLRIDRHETENAAAGRIRTKIASIHDLLNVAHNEMGTNNPASAELTNTR